MSVLKAEGVRVAVGSRVLVDDLDLEIGPGELLVILGRNGTGKTLLLHTLAGLRAPTAGAVRLDSRPLADIGRRQVARRLGLLLQIYEDAFPLRVVGELTQQTTDARRATRLKHVIERLEPFASFERFELGRILRGSVPHQSSKIRYKQPSIVAPDICHETAQRQSSVESR